MPLLCCFLCNFAKTFLIMSKKYLSDLEVCAVERLSPRHVLIKLTHSEPLPDILPGQFVEGRVENSPETFLRRPISVNYVDRELNQLWLLVAEVGSGTRHLAELKPGECLDCLYPLGNGFTLPSAADAPVLLIGGGVGTAPLLFLGKQLQDRSIHPVFLLGGRSAGDILEVELFRQLGDVFFTTEDGSLGERGFVTDHSLLQKNTFSHIYCCGPKPMMMAVARYANSRGIDCEVSLENKMACGLGACLCCVEKTVEGNLRVCEDGPVFNVKKLLWK